jgi:hypothetical protein
MQYQIDGITEELDRALREFAEREGVSLNDAALRTLSVGLDIEFVPPKRRDLSAIFDGTPLEPEVIEALESQRQIDWEMWGPLPGESGGDAA